MPRQYPAVDTSIFSHVFKKVGTVWENDIQTWKISFDPAASTEYRIRVVKNYLSDWNSLNHDLFLVALSDTGTIATGSVQLYASDNPDHTLAIVPTNRRLVKFPGSNDPGDLEISDEDVSVTNNLNAGVGRAFRKVRLSSSFLSNPAFTTLTHVWIVVRFIGDYIKPESFDQDLHLTAQVQHQNLFVNGNLTVNGLSALTQSQIQNLTVNQEIQGNLFKTFYKMSGSQRILLSRELLAQKLTLRSSELLTSTIQNFDSTAPYQLATTTNATMQGVQSGVSGNALSEWNSWKDLPTSFAVYGKVTEITNFNSNPVTYQNNVVSAANIQHAIALQYNPYSKTWQAGQLGDNQEFSQFTEAELTWFSNSANYIGPRLRGNLPFIVRSKVPKSDQLAGRILFFNSTPGYEDLVDVNPTFRVQGTGNNLFLTVPNFAIRQTTSTFEGSVEISRVSINKPQSLPDTNITSDGTIVFYATIQDNSLSPKYSYFAINYGNEMVSLGIRPPSGSQEFYNSANVISFLTYDADFDKNYDLMTLGNSSQNVYLNTTSSRFSVSSPLLKLGQHNGVNYVYGQTIFFADDPEANSELAPRGNEGATNRVLVLKDFAPATNNTNSPLIFSPGLVSRLSTNGTIQSPTIDHIWQMFRSIITNQGTTALQNEVSWWNAPSSNPDNTLYSEVSTIISNPGINTYRPIDYSLSSIPLTLRQLEIALLKERYNFTTFVNYVKSRKVDKGLNGNDGNNENYGSLWQLHKDEIPYDNSLKTADGQDTSRSDVYLASDGTWKYLFDEVLLPIKNE